MKNKSIYIWILVCVVIALTSCAETSTKTENESKPRVEESDTIIVEFIDSTGLQMIVDTVVEEVADNKEVVVPKKDVFAIYKNGIRQNLVIAWNTDPENATEDWVWFTDDIDRHFKETHPVENLMYFPSPPDGIEFHHMAELATELGIEGPHAGYYLIGESKKFYVNHDMVHYVLMDIYDFFEIEQPEEE